jgi:hypothetical protein
MRLFAYSLLLLASPAFASKLAPTGAADSETLRGNVLVWHDASLFTQADETAQSVKLATFDVPRADRVGHVVAMKVVSAKGAFVEVELVGDDDCTWSHVVVPDDLARVRLFVRRADLAPALVKPFTKSFPDGTSITLAPGTPLVATDTGTHVISWRGDELEVDVPSGSVGHSYRPSRAESVMSAGQTLAVAKTTKATVGERALALTAWNASPVERRGESTVVALEDRCISAHVAVPTKALSDVDESTINVGANSGGSAVLALRDECFLPKLTPLSVGAHQVAVAAKPIYLHSEPMGKQACIQRQIRIESALEIKATDEKLRFCAPAKRVARDVMRRPRSAAR